MDSKSILVGIVIGILVGGVVGYTSVPAPDYTPYENQITQFQSQVLSLSSEIDDLEYQLMEAPSQEDYNELQQQVSILEASVNSADFNINLLTEEVASLESEISDFEAPVEFEFVTVSFSRPEDTSSLLQYWIGKANVTIQLMVMLITQDELASSLIDAHERGVDVDVIIDDDWVSSSGSDYQGILDAGIDIRGDERGGLMHHKVMIIDGYIVVVGSYNWSASAEDSNDENLLVLKSTVIATQYLEEFDRILAQTSYQAPTTTYSLSISVSGSGSISPSVGSYSYSAGSSVSVSVAPSSGWDFSYWLLDGENSGSQNPKVVSMDEDHTIRAVFVEGPSSPPSQYTLTISKSGSGFTSPSTEDHSYDEGMSVSVTATPGSGWDFDHWILDGQNVGGQNPYGLTMNDDYTLTAVFEEEPQQQVYVVINEVEQNPSGNDNYGSVYEWVELYNKGSSAADISGWTLTATGGTPVTKTIAQGTVLQPGQRKIIQSGSQWLDNSGERVVLKDDQGTTKDQTPTLNDDDNDDRSWQRSSDGGSSWVFRTSTKNSSN